MRSAFTSRIVRKLGLICAIGATSALGGCYSDTGRFAALGAGIGAGTGAIIGHQSGHGGEGALIGAGAGALAGALIGNDSDKHHMEQRCNSGYRCNSNYDY